MAACITLDGNHLAFEQLQQIASGAPIAIAKGTAAIVNASRKIVDDVIKHAAPVYGVNTGFGYFANKKIGSDDLRQLQLNLLRSHACGWGKPLTSAETRLAMVLRLNVLLKGYTGVRFELCEALLQLINANIYPIIPEYGSLGASGDLAPLAHLALALIGEGDVLYGDKIMPAAHALAKASLTPIQLHEKEGLGLINGTQIMLAVGGLALCESLKIAELSDRICALSYEALQANTTALDKKIHAIRGQLGQIESASTILHELHGSYLFDDYVIKRVQDPYSLRCAPQVHGASRDAINYCKTIIERELNAATDNPLVFDEHSQILSGGNFHGQPLALAFDFCAIALSEIGNISERRLELMLNPHMNASLPAFLTNYEGLNCGLMLTQYLAGSLVNANKGLANPAATDSIPGNVGVEDHVSMGMTSARKLKTIAANVKCILAIELIAACQAIDLRDKSSALGQGTRRLYAALRNSVATLDKDRILATDVEQANKVIESLIKL